MSEIGTEELSEIEQKGLGDLVSKFGGIEHSEEDGFKFVEFENPQDFLEAITTSGDYLFSGSSRRVNGELDPSSSVSILPAIYMTRNPVLAMFHGLVGGMDDKISRENTITMQIDDNTGEITYPVADFSIGNPEAIAEEGYVYIIKNSLKYARNENGEYLSSDSVNPDLILKFKKENFPFEIRADQDKADKYVYTYHIEDRDGVAEVTINIDALELKRINDLADIFSKLSDTEFSGNIDKIKNESPRLIGQLRGIRQNSPHEGIDAYDHTFNTFKYLDTSNNTPEEKTILRMTLLLHDIGKIGASSRDHARWSEKMVANILEKTDLSDEIKRQIEIQVKYHDFLGDVSRGDREHSVFTEDQSVELFGTLEAFGLHRQIVVADISSIPGLALNVPNIEKKYVDSQKYFLRV